MATTTYNLMRQAVQKKKQVRCVFQELPCKICFHVIGLKNGKEQALGFQSAGQSSKGRPPEGQWRCMPISGLSDVQLVDGAWHTGEGHSQDQTYVDRVDVEVKYWRRHRCQGHQFSPLSRSPVSDQCDGLDGGMGSSNTRCRNFRT